MSAIKNAVGDPGYIAILAVVVGGLLKLARTNRLNAFLARFGFKPIPRAYIPWLSLALGTAAAAIDFVASGSGTWHQAGVAAAQGFAAGAIAIAGHETLAKTKPRLHAEKTASVLVPESMPTQPELPPHADDKAEGPA